MSPTVTASRREPCHPGRAAATFDPARATGLDGALRAVAAEPHGAWVLVVVAVGLAAFSVYCLARARHPVG